MDFYRKVKEMRSEDAGEDVSILEYRKDDNHPYIECSRCGQLIRRKMFVVQSKETDIELFYLGPECIKHLK